MITALQNIKSAPTSTNSEIAYNHMTAACCTLMKQLMHHLHSTQKQIRLEMVGGFECDGAT